MKIGLFELVGLKDGWLPGNGLRLVAQTCLSGVAALLFTSSVTAAPAPENSAYSVFEVKAIANMPVTAETGFRHATEAQTIRIVAARGEYEPFSFVIVANDDLIDVKPRLSAGLHGDNGMLGADTVNLRLVKRWFQGCVNSIHFKHCPNGNGRFLVPELLLKDSSLVRVDLDDKMNWLRVNVSGKQQYVDITSTESDNRKRGDDRNIPANATFDDADVLQPVSIARNSNQQFWGTIYVPPDTEPGTYAGSIQLSSSNAAGRELNLELEVLPFDLADSGLEHSIYYKGRLAGRGKEVIGVSTDLKTEEQLSREMVNLVTHGVDSATTTQTYSRNNDLLKRELEARRDAGMNNKLYMLWSGTYFEHKVLAKELMQYVKRFGHDEIYFYGGEELSDEEWANSEQKWGLMRNLGGKVFIGRSHPDFAEAVDLGVGGTRKLTMEQARERSEAYHKHGNRIFARTNPQVGVENADMYRRNYGMVLLAMGFDGTMNYAYQDSWGSIWNDFDGYFRDHVFAYPTSDGLIDTIQWEGFREGVDDAKYMMTLQNTIAEARKADIDVTAVEQWIAGIDYQTADLDLIRERIIDEILALRKALTHD